LNAENNCDNTNDASNTGSCTIDLHLIVPDITQTDGDQLTIDQQESIINTCPGGGTCSASRTITFDPNAPITTTTTSAAATATTTSPSTELLSSPSPSLSSTTQTTDGLAGLQLSSTTTTTAQTDTTTSSQNTATTQQDQQQQPTESVSVMTSAAADSQSAEVTTTPKLITSDNIIAEATSSTGATVTYANPTVSNAVDGNRVSIDCNPPSGSTFPIGTTTVICTARDSGGLSSQSTFTVTVGDTTAPSFTSRVQDITVQAAVGQSGATVTYATPTAYDIVDGPVTVSCSPASGSTFPLTTTMVTCTARDSHGNTASSQEATFTVTVIPASR
jgi:hypothetical protein